jgi:undecaprenyl-diphosphatase
VISALDRAAARRAAETGSWASDHVLPGLSRLASRGLLWLALAAALWASGDRQARRAAWRGVGSMAAASVAANVIGKGLTRRRRPYLDVPVRRRLPRAPRSSSFPSGHAANAAAFVTGAAIEMPYLAAPGIALAAAVGASRVTTGMHYLSDVLAGTAIGATAGLATLRWWPRQPPLPARATRPPWRAPASAAGEGLALVVNTSAGTASAKLARRLSADLPRARIVETSAGEDLTRSLRDAAAGARILGVAGGDGTVSAAAAVALEAGLPLLVIPAGTFNHFAADIGVGSARDALAALRKGEAAAVDLGLAGDRPFVNTSSTGVYADMVRLRRQLDPVLGKRLAEVAALIGVLRSGRPHELVLDGKQRRLWLYFAGNCCYVPQGTAPAYRRDLADGWLDIRVVEAAVLARSRLVAAVLTGTLGRSRVYRAWRARSVEVRAADGQPVWLSADGEVASAETGFTHRKHPRGLVVYRPQAPLHAHVRGGPPYPDE